jgi:hypothetical protein
LRDHEQDIRATGATLAVIGLGNRRHAAAFRRDAKITFPVLVDEARTAYRAADLGSASLLHLLRPDNHRARKRAKASGHRQHGVGKNPFQLGGSFIFAPGNEDRFTHVSATFGDNAAVADLLGALSAAT